MSTTASSPTLTVATYNVLADSYIKPEHYPRCDLDVFVSEKRHPRIIERVVGFNADVICLQEVESSLFALLAERLSLLGYRSFWQKKVSRNKPDGCVISVRAPWRLIGESSLAFSDNIGSPGEKSGHIASFAIVAHGDHRLLVINTHLKWEPLDTPREKKIGLVQAIELVRTVPAFAIPTIVCGDFNAEHGSSVLNTFQNAGFVDAHPHNTFTFNTSDPARKIDFILHTAELCATPHATPAIDDATVLPSDTEPSDHLPLIASFSF